MVLNPYPINGLIYAGDSSTPYPEVSIALKSVSRNYTLSDTSESDGSYAFDLANFPGGYENGDQFKLEARLGSFYSTATITVDTGLAGITQNLTLGQESLTGVMDLTRLKEEITIFFRKNLADPLNRDSIKTAELSGTGSQVKFALPDSNVKYVDSVYVNNALQDCYTDYFLDYNDASNLSNPTLYFLNPPANSALIEVKYDYGSGWIFPDIPRCFTDTAEVLTELGWKNIKDVNVGDNVLTLNNDTDVLEYNKVLSKTEQVYNGVMKRIRNLQLDTLVTPNHRFLVRDGNNLNKRFFREAKNLKIGNRIVRTGSWKGNNANSITIKGYYNLWYSGRKHLIENKISLPDITLNINDYVSLLGIYLAEGNVTKVNKRTKVKGRENYVCISQTKHKDEIRELLKRLPFRFSEYKDERDYRKASNFLITDKRLGVHFKEFGNDSYTYFIPRWILGLSKETLENLFKWMILGDGSRIDKSDDTYEYYTCSEQLANDMCELAVKLGRAAKITLRDSMTTFGRCKIFRVKIYGERYRNARIFRETIKDENYSGKVYCITTKNSTFVVRDNKRTFVTGNSDLKLFSYPRVNVKFVNIRTREDGLGAGGNITDVLGDVQVWSAKDSELLDIINDARQAIINNKKNFHYFKLMIPQITGPVLVVPNREDRLVSQTQGFQIMFRLEVA